MSGLWRAGAGRQRWETGEERFLCSRRPGRGVLLARIGQECLAGFQARIVARGILRRVEAVRRRQQRIPRDVNYLSRLHLIGLASRWDNWDFDALSRILNKYFIISILTE